MNQNPLSALNTGTRSRVTISVNVARHRGVLVEAPRLARTLLRGSRER